MTPRNPRMALEDTVKLSRIRTRPPRCSRSPRSDLLSLADEARRGGRVSNIPRLARRISKATSLRSRRDGLHAREIGPEILKTYEKLGSRLPTLTMHRCMERRVITGSPPPALPPHTPVSQVSVHPDIRNCSCDVAQAKVQAALLASGDGNNEGARQSCSGRKCLAHRGDHLEQRYGAIELAARPWVCRTQAVRPDHPFDPGAIRPWQFLRSLMAL